MFVKLHKRYEHVMRIVEINTNGYDRFSTQGMYVNIYIDE